MKTINDQVDLRDFFNKIGKRTALLMLDYDGTLAPLVKERMQAYLYPGVKERLETLCKLKTTRTVIVSGRSLADLETLLKMTVGIELWGSHGLERKLPNGKKECTEVGTKVREGLEEGKKVCQQLDPDRCEIKPFAVALHWRGVDEMQQNQIRSIEEKWEGICSRHDLEVHQFDGGIELRPKGMTKGDVVRKLMSEAPSDVMLAYLGDDMTDEDAFEAIGNRGLKILVRDQLRPTLADIYITPPQELLAFLDHWILSTGETSK